MPSSTSSSDERLLSRGWLHAWLLSLAAATLVFAGLEALARVVGHETNIRDDLSLWSMERERVYETGSRTVVLLGASRMQLAFSMQTFRDRYPDRALVQLSMNGGYPVAALRDLGEDKRFNGVVIVALSGFALTPERAADQKHFVRFYRKAWTLDAKLNRVIDSWLQNHLVAINPCTEFRRLIGRTLVSRPIPGPYYVRMHTDRSRAADYASVDVADKRRKRLRAARRAYSRDPTPIDQWMVGAHQVDDAVRAIQARGGQVALVRLPTTGEHWELDEQNYPRAKYWDRLAEMTSAATVHFADVPEMLELECPDSSHLDYRDTPRFTSLLLNELERQGVLTPDP